MTGLTVKPANGETTYYGKQVKELQENIAISDSAITGKLKHVTGFTGFGGAEEGNFLALIFTANSGATIKTKVIGGSEKEVELTQDKYCVYHITSNQTQKIEVVAEKDGKKTTKTYDLKGLTLAQ